MTPASVLTVRQASERMGVSPRTIYDLCDSGRLGASGSGLGVGQSGFAQLIWMIARTTAPAVATAYDPDLPSVVFFTRLVAFTADTRHTGFLPAWIASSRVA